MFPLWQKMILSGRSVLHGLYQGGHLQLHLRGICTERLVTRLFKKRVVDASIEIQSLNVCVFIHVY